MLKGKKKYLAAEFNLLKHNPWEKKQIRKNKTHFKLEI